MVAARIAVVNWTRRHAGGIETYIEDLVSELARAGRAVGFWHEGDDPVDRAPLIFPSSVPQWSGASGTAGAVEALEAWKPSVLVVNGLQSPDVEARLLRVAPAALVAHTYYGTCISGSKTHTFPAPQP